MGQSVAAFYLLMGHLKQNLKEAQRAGPADKRDLKEWD